MKRHVSGVMIAILLRAACAPFTYVEVGAEPAVVATLDSTVYDPQVMGQRGTRTGAPENTMPAFAYAVNARADAVEFDVYWTKATSTQKSVMVVIHDPTLDRTTDCAGKRHQSHLVKGSSM